jgi:hypothetical protein
MSAETYIFYDSFKPIFDVLVVLNFNLFIRPGDNPLFHIFAVYIIKCFTRDILVFSTISAYNDMLIVLILSLGDRMLKAVHFQPKGQITALYALIFG